MIDVMHSTILIIDDQEQNIAFLERLLRRYGYRHIISTVDSHQAIPFIVEEQPDLIMLDLEMPHMDGFDVLEKHWEVIPVDEYLPIIAITADHSRENLKRALREGAMDFLTKPFDRHEVLLRCRNLLQTRHLHQRLKDHNRAIGQMVAQQTLDVDQAHEHLVHSEVLNYSSVEILNRLAKAAEYRDDETGQHTFRVGYFAGRIAENLGFNKETSAMISKAARLHDLGKIGIPDDILLKPGRFDDEERTVMRQHCHIGANLLSGSNSELLQLAESIALSHHEHWNGNGYPHRLSGDNIPLEGRIVAVADVFDALTHARPYKQAWTAEKAMSLLIQERGRHFDPQVVDTFVAVIEETEFPLDLRKIPDNTNHLLA